MILPVPASVARPLTVTRVELASDRQRGHAWAGVDVRHCTMSICTLRSALQRKGTRSRAVDRAQRQLSASWPSPLPSACADQAALAYDGVRHSRSHDHRRIESGEESCGATRAACAQVDRHRPKADGLVELCRSEWPHTHGDRPRRPSHSTRPCLSRQHDDRRAAVTTSTRVP